MMRLALTGPRRPVGVMFYQTNMKEGSVMGMHIETSVVLSSHHSLTLGWFQDHWTVQADQWREPFGTTDEDGHTVTRMLEECSDVYKVDDEDVAYDVWNDLRLAVTEVLARGGTVTFGDVTITREGDEIDLPGDNESDYEGGRRF